MKKNLFYAGMLLLGMTVATGCSNEETLEQVASNGKTIQAVIEKATEARTSVSDNYQVFWTEDDAFSVFDNGTKQATLTLSDGAGTTSGKFTIDDSEVTITEDMVALFPTSDALSYTYAASYNSQETDAPMLGTFEDGKFTFSLLTAMVRVVVTNVPQGTATLAITAGTDINLTGAATLNSNNDLDVPTSGTNAVTVTINNQTENATLTFDVPVPAQEYTNGLNVKLTVGNDDVFNKTTNVFTAEVGKIYVFGAKTVSVDDTEDLTSTIQDLLEGGYSVVLEGEAEEVAVSALSVPENTTASLDLSGKKLILGETASTMALGRAADDNTIGITNSGVLTLSNGAIEYTGDYAILNKGILTLDKVNLTASYIAVKNEGVWDLTTDMTIQKYEGTDAVVKFTMNGGSITSTTDITNPNVYAVEGVDYGIIDIKDAEIKGTDAAGGIHLNCAVANLENVTITRGSSGTAHQVHVISGILNYSGTTTIDNYRYYYGDDHGQYGFAEVNGTYYGEINTPISTSVSDSNTLKSALSNIEDGAIIVLADDITSTEQLTFNNANKTLTLDLNGKTLTLQAEKGLVNNGGTLIIKNGNISGTNSASTLYNESVNNNVVETQLNNVYLTASYIAVKNVGVWDLTTDMTIQKYEGTDAVVKFTMNGGSITSTTDITNPNVYAVVGVDYGIIDIKDAEIKGTDAAGGIHLNCAVANLENVTITRGSSGTAHQVHVISGILNYSGTTTIDNYRYYYGDDDGQYGYAEVNGTYYGEINQIVTNSSIE